MRPMVLALILAGCGGNKGPAADTATTDLDGDGFLEPDDCGEGDAAVNPDATDTVGDDIDQNCDGLDGVDLDGDGFASEPSGGDDCDDADETVNPDAPEIPYDAIDQDCDGADLTDVDGDGEDSDQVGGPDCDDDDPAIHSGATDIPYDGIDQDCDGSDLLDADGDGFDAESMGGDDCDDADPGINPEASEVPYNGIDEDCDGADLTDVDGDGYESDLVGGLDCNDIRADTYPGAVEVPYDGIDQDCDGTDLTDADGDGIDARVAGGLDCDDTDPLVFPGAPDTCYDGVDSDCGGGSDYDCDGDGIDAQAFGGDDCDDNDPLVGGGTLEAIGDGIDGDCRNDGDLAHMSFGGFTFDNPRPPRLAATTEHYILASAADSYDMGFAQPANVGFVLAFNRTSGTDAAPIGSANLWQGATNPQPLGQAVDLITDGDNYWASTTYTHSATNWTYLVARRAEWDPAFQSYIMREIEYFGTPLTHRGTSVDVVIDSTGDPWAVACGVDTLHALKGIGVIPTPADALGPGPVLPAGVPGGVCFWQDAPDPLFADLGELVLCETGVDCASYTFDPITEVLDVDAVHPWSGSTIAHADFRDGWHNVVYTGGDAWVLGFGSHQIFGGHTVQSMDAVWYGPDLYAVAVVTENGAPELVLSYGDPNVSMTEVTMDFGDPARPNLVLTGAAVMADADRLVIAISADDPGLVNDAIGWVFYALP